MDPAEPQTTGISEQGHALRGDLDDARGGIGAFPRAPGGLSADTCEQKGEHS